MKLIGKIVCGLACSFFAACALTMPIIHAYAVTNSPAWLVEEVGETRWIYDLGTKIDQRHTIIKRESHALNVTCLFSGLTCLGLSVVCGYAAAKGE